jgi:hypothetical protein
MTSLNFTDIAEVGSKGRDGGSFLVQVSGVGVAINAIVYSGILNEDVDGAPQCYGRFPADAGIDHLVNATNLVGGGIFNGLPKGVVAHPWKWVGVANMTHDDTVAAGLLARLDERSELAGRFSANAPMNNPITFPPKFPVLRADNNQFYVSTTALARNAALPETDPGHWWDATTVQYGALTPPLRDLGVDFGDFGVAIRRDTGDNGAFFFADSGSGNKIGEMSRMLFRALFPRNDQEEHLVSFIVFPGSRLRPIGNNPRPTLLSLFSVLSNTSNVGTMIDIMASGTSFAQLKDRPELMYVIDDMQRFRTHRAPDLDLGRNAGRTQTIATALRQWGFDPAAAERARAAAEAAEPKSLGLAIPPPPADIMNLKIPKP